jgi:hypothetical protein
MADDDQQTLKLLCYSPVTGIYEAEVAADICCSEVIEGLVRERFLGLPQQGERYQAVVRRTVRELAPSDRLVDVGVVDGDELVIILAAHGAGPSVVDLAEVLAAAKVAIDAAQLVVDAHRAKTERMSFELKRTELEAEARGGQDEKDSGD